MIQFVLLAVVALVGVYILSQIQLNYLISQVSSQVRILPIYEVATDKKVVSISFDASWGAEHTLEIVDILDKYQVKATFFLVNIWLEDYPDMAREIVARGHEVGLHSVSHPHFCSLSDQQMIDELNKNYALIKEVTGFEPKLFRPPFGEYDNRVIDMVTTCGFQSIQWSIDSLDWKDLSAAEIERRVMKNMSAGDIVLFHNNGKHTAEALEPIILKIKEKGLELIPISDLLLKGDWYIDYNGVQRQGNQGTL
jgi:polysaccharide deacetylase family sporulation protein PdaB